MTNYDLWHKLSRAHLNVLQVCEPEHGAVCKMFGAPLRTHQEVALQQLAELAETLEAEPDNPDSSAKEIAAGIRGIHFLIEHDQAQGASLLLEIVAHKIYNDSLRDAVQAREEGGL